MLDDNEWSEWDGDNDGTYVIALKEIAPGAHSLKIQVCYHPDLHDSTDDTIAFFRASPPLIIKMTDTLLEADDGAPCTLWVKAKGTSELTYDWYHDKTKLDSGATDSLLLDTVSINDTAYRWYCHVHSRWGDDTSANIRLRVMLHVLYDGNKNTDGVAPEDTNRYKIGRKWNELPF